MVTLERSGRRIPLVRETSAGGVCIKIENGVPHVALIMRRTRQGHAEWCLPKGHIEAGETAEQTAIREITEETGVKGVIVYPINVVEYWFYENSMRVHKRVHHFLLEYKSGKITTDNDPDQEAEDAKWISLHKAPNLLSHANEKQVARMALSLLFPKK